MSAPIPLGDLFRAAYAVGGRGPARYDCYGLFVEVQRRLGRAMPVLDTPEAYADRAQAIADGALDWQPLPAPEPWCAVAIRVGRWVSHLGVVLDDGVHFLHATRATGVTRARLDDPRWASRIAGYYRWIGS